MAIYDARAGQVGLEIWYIPGGGLLRCKVDNVVACDTDEGWLEMVLYGKQDGGLAAAIVQDGELLTVKVYMNYEVVDGKTGQVLHTVYGYRKDK